MSKAFSPNAHPLSTVEAIERRALSHALRISEIMHKLTVLMFSIGYQRF